MPCSFSIAKALKCIHNNIDILEINYNSQCFSKLKVAFATISPLIIDGIRFITDQTCAV